MKKSTHQLIALTSLGGTLEFYDFTIYALFAPYISQLFFSNENPSISLMQTFSVFALGYFARPLGGIFFGHLGDKWGRKLAFSSTVFTMALATLLIGCLPTYASIGIAAPGLLILLRLIQGFSVGGEIPGASVFIIEHVPPMHHGVAIGIVLMCVTLGNTIGAGVGLLLTTIFNEQQMMSFGWRIPFIIGFLLGLIGYIIRKKTPETPIFITMKNNNTLFSRPLFILLKAPLKVIHAFLITATTSSIISLFLYFPTYISMVLKLNISYAYLVNLIAFLILALMTGFFGWLSDNYSRSIILRTGAILTMTLSYPLFYELNLQGESFIWFFIFGFALLGGIINGSYVVMMTKLFPANLRYSAVGLSYSLGLAVFGGIAPLAFTWMIEVIKQPEAPAFYIMGCAVFTTLALFYRSNIDQ